MSRGLVLVIEDDEWVSRLLQSAIREAGYDVVVCATARAGLDAAFTQHPDCIVCDIDLPDEDGYSVARHVRTHSSRVSVTPFLFLSGLDDEQSRIEGFHVGADVYITKPFRVDEVVAQIEALVHMASRLRARRDSMLSLPPGGAMATAIEGDLGQMSIATVLTVLEMERRTGIFEVTSKKRRAHLDIVSGSVMDGTVGGTKVSALAALRTMLGWHVGRFSFVPSEHREVPASHHNKSLGAFLIEALRLEDEATRAELELPPSRHRPNEPRLPAPALGGPASTPANFAPPSTRTPRPSELSLILDPELSEWEIPADIAPTDAAPRSLPDSPRLAPMPPPPPEPTPPAGGGHKDRAATPPPVPRAHIPRPTPLNVPRPTPPLNAPRPPPQADKKR